ncbi:MAG: hypothetical protein KIT51_04820 [Cyclobacteriaceae bacterium]|nr:MAG: hypothetical protein KIT51_04820 [Cyclobacteriaceae bacterium]
MTDKQLLTLILLIVAVSCSDKKIDSKTNDTSQSQTPNITPDWLTKLYPKDISDENYPYKTQSITTFKQLNDSLTFCILSINDGVCNTDILAIQINRNKGTETEIGKSCDQDLAWSKYESKTYKILSDWTIEVKEYSETVDNKFIDDSGFIIDGYNFEDIEDKKIDSVKYQLTIDPNGQIKKKT